MNEGSTTPIIAAIAPFLPILYPTKVDEFIAMAPGMDSETANTSIISSSF